MQTLRLCCSIKGLILFMCTLAVTEKSFLKYSYTELMTATLDQCLPEVQVGIDCTRYYAGDDQYPYRFDLTL